MRSHQILVEKIKGDFHFKSASVMGTRGLISSKKKKRNQGAEVGKHMYQKGAQGPCWKPPVPTWADVMGLNIQEYSSNSVTS